MDEKEPGGVARTFQEDWVISIGFLRVSYAGEAIEKAVPLTLRQILPGGLVDIIEVLPAKLQDPEDLVMSPAQGLPPRPKVRKRCLSEVWSSRCSNALC